MRRHWAPAIHPQTNDLYLDETKNLAIVQNAHAVGQHVRQRLMTFEGEWFLDTRAGVPWLDQLLGRNYDPALAEAVVKAEILDTDAVTEVLEFSVRFLSDPRNLDIHSVEIMTEYDLEVLI